MSFEKLNQKGFAALEAVLVVVILAIIGGTGYYVYHANQKATDTQNAAQTAANTAAPQTRLTSEQAVAKVQKLYDAYLVAINAAAKSNAAASPTDKSIQPVQVSGLAAVKPYLSTDFYKQVSPAKAGKDQIGCALYSVDSYKASLLNEAQDKKTAVVAVDIHAGDSINGRITVTVDLLTGKVTQITCPA